MGTDARMLVLVLVPAQGNVSTGETTRDKTDAAAPSGGSGARGGPGENCQPLTSDGEVTGVGSEHPPQTPEKTDISERGGAQGGAPGALSTITDPDR